MKIDVYLSEICGSYYRLRENIDSALAELGISPAVEYHTISYDEAVSKGITGSPSVRIDGKEAFPGDNAPGIT